jgi:hypothetical protein
MKLGELIDRLTTLAALHGESTEVEVFDPSVCTSYGIDEAAAHEPEKNLHIIEIRMIK